MYRECVILLNPLLRRALILSCLSLGLPFEAQAAFDPDNPLPQPIGQGRVTVRLTPVASGLVAPNWGIAAPGDAGRLFVADQTGTLWAIDLASKQKTVFADLSNLLALLSVGESGFLGVAFHPNYSTNGLLYTFTSEQVNGPADFSTLPPGAVADHQSVVREWTVPFPTDPNSVVDPNSSRVVLRIDKPQANHNGGGLNFGKDKRLYLSTGDGGGGNDAGTGHSPQGNAQDRGNVLGKILRIDPDARTSANGQYGIPGKNPFAPRNALAAGGQTGCADGKCDEIFAYGLRNPFRFSFDLPRGDLYAADVGQNAIEEVDVIRAGRNYGWRIKEGTFCFDPGAGVVTPARSCGPGKFIGPVAQYDHSEGHAIIGGFVYRGKTIPGLRGRYVFGDYSGNSVNGGRLFFLTRKNIVGASGIARSKLAEMTFVSGQSGLGVFLLGFGKDAAGELYVLGNTTGGPSGATGVVLKIEPP